MDPNVMGQLLAIFLVCIVVLLTVIAVLAKKELRRLVEIIDRIPDKSWFDRITRIAENATIELVEHRIRIETLERREEK